MVYGRRRDRRGLQLAVRRQHLQHRAEGLAAELAGHSIGAVHIGIDHAQQSNRLSLLFEFFVDAGMIASKNTHSNHGDGNRIFGWQETFSRWLVAGEIVIAIALKSTRAIQQAIGFLLTQASAAK